MQSISFQINEQLRAQLEHLANLQERSKGYIMRKAIESYIQDQNDLKIAQEALEEFNDNGAETYSLDEVKQENDL